METIETKRKVEWCEFQLLDIEKVNEGVSHVHTCDELLRSGHIIYRPSETKYYWTKQDSTYHRISLTKFMNDVYMCLVLHYSDTEYAVTLALDDVIEYLMKPVIRGYFEPVPGWNDSDNPVPPTGVCEVPR